MIDEMRAARAAMGHLADNAIAAVVAGVANNDPPDWIGQAFLMAMWGVAFYALFDLLSGSYVERCNYHGCSDYGGG